MISQLRIYTVNRGMMDDWIDCFESELLPMMREHGMQVEHWWTNEQRTEFIWIRSYDNERDLTEIEASFYGSPEWLAARDRIASHIAKTEVRSLRTAEQSN